MDVGRRHPGLFVLVTVVLGLAVAGCAPGRSVQVGAPPTANGSSSGTNPGPAASSGPQPVPVVGDCHGPVDARIIDAPTDVRPTVPCDGPHGTETFYVGELDATITTWPGDANNEALGGQVDQACTGPHLEYLGTTAETATTLPPDRLQGFAYFIPTKTDFASGARWFRCDALVNPVDPTKPTTINGTLKDVYAKPLPAAYRLCGTTLGRDAACDGDHDFEYFASVILPDVADYPPPRNDIRVTAACRTPLLAALALTEERTDLAFGYLLPSETDWDQGLHGALCVVGTADSKTLDGTLAGIGPTKPLPLAPG